MAERQRRPRSLQARLALLTAVLLSICLGAAGLVLDRAFNAAALARAEENLRAVAYLLQGAAEESGETLAFRGDLGDPRLSQPDSGLYAFLDTVVEGTIWRSPSAIASPGNIGAAPPLPKRPAPGEFFFGETQAQDGARPPRFVLAYTVVWETVGHAEMTFWIFADQASYRAEVTVLRRYTAIGFGSAAVAFILMQLGALRWGLTPLRRMASRIGGLEAGARGDIGSDYPKELLGVAHNVNRFADYERQNRNRYRRAMDDLAHSLKTPLAVLRNTDGEVAGRAGGLLREQVDRMQTVIDHQLARAAAMPSALPAESIPAMPVAARIVGALQRAYAEKAVAATVEESPLMVRVDERDLMEMLGNVIENAFKYGQSRIRIAAARIEDSVAITVEDDGPGIEPSRRELVQQRGARADVGTAGQGIGLAAAAEIAAAYDGRLDIADSADLGGAAVRIFVPVPK